MPRPLDDGAKTGYGLLAFIAGGTALVAAAAAGVAWLVWRRWTWW